MPLSTYMPDVKVEIAFNVGLGSQPAARSWTDVSAYVLLDRGLNITFGRQDERSLAGANMLKLTLDNSDGRFTPDRAASPYFPGVKLDRPIRVTATPVGGTSSERFVGFINSWPVSWDQGVDTSASVTITASSKLARLGLARKLRSIVEETILLDDPAAYYPLGEPKDSTSAADVSGAMTATLLVADGFPLMTFGDGAGPGTDDSTAATFGYVVGQVNQHLEGAVPAVNTGSGVRLGAFMTGTTWVGSVPGTAARVRSPGPTYASGPDFVAVEVGATGFYSGTAYPVAYGRVVLGTSSWMVEGPSMADGGTHRVEVQVTFGSPSTIQLFFDGAGLPPVNFTCAPADLAAAQLLEVGLLNSGTVSHVDVGTNVLSSLRMLERARSGMTGFDGEETDARLLRYGAFMRGAAQPLTTEAPSTRMAHVPLTGKDVVSAMRVVEATEGGVLFDSPSGATVLHNRAHRYLATPALALDMAQQQVEATFAPRLDRSALVNDVTASNLSGSVKARMADASSGLSYGVATATETTASVDATEPALIAGWVVNAYKEPSLRVPALAVDLLAQADKTPGAQALYAVTMGTMVRVLNQPAQADRTTADYFVEGYTESYGTESVLMTFNVSPSAPYDRVLVWDSPTRGVWGTSTWAY